MMNMTYCQFRNTLKDIRQCANTMESEEWDDPDMSDDEHGARAALIVLCKQIVEEYGDKIDE